MNSEIEIIEVVHVADPLTNEGKGTLCISLCPGKKDNRWNRDLEKDLLKIKEHNIQIIICLIQWSEMKMLNIMDYPRRAQEEGILFYHLPIKDRRAPTLKEVDALVPYIVKHLINGQNVLVHCRGGLGRAGTICGCCLAHFGFDGISAINLVRIRRPGAIQTQCQHDCIVNYCEIKGLKDSKTSYGSVA